MRKENSMSKRGVVMGVAVITALSFMAVSGCKGPGTEAAKKESKPAASSQAALKKEAPKRVFPKNTGGLTVRIADSKNKAIPVKIRAFRVSDNRSGVFMASFTSNNMQLLPAGTYDIEIDTVPQKLYKSVSVQNGRETTEDLGSMTGSLMVKAMNAKNQEGRYPIRVFYEDSAVPVATGMTGKPMEIVSGPYDIVIVTMPNIKKNVRIETGKEALMDLGANMGELTIKAADESGKPARVPCRIRNKDTGEMVASSVTNRPLELISGLYEVEIQQKTGVPLKKEAKINPGESTMMEFVVQAPPAPARAAVKAPVKAPAKKK